MSVRSTWFAALLVVAGACAADDEDWIVRPPGGGGTGSGTEGDARQVDAAVGDGGVGQVQGLICVVTDLRQPDVCPDVTARVGVVVRISGEATSATSAADGRFTLAAIGLQVGLDVADNVATLTRSRLRVPVGPALVHAPVPTKAYFDAVIATLGSAPADNTGAIVVYVDDVTAPATGVVFDLVPGAGVPPFYDGNGPLAWREQGGTGAAGVTLMIDIPPGVYAITGIAPDQRTVVLSGISVESDRVTFVRGRLP